MSDTKGFVSIQNIVSDVEVELDDFTGRHRKRMVRFAMRAMEQLSLHGLNKYKIIKLYVDRENNTVQLPSDFLRFLSIGYSEGGYFVTYTEDKKILTPLNQISEDDTLGSYDYDPEIYPYSGINETYYQVDINNNRIILGGEIRDEVFLKYISSGVSTEGNTYIPVIAQDAVVSYIRWKLEDGNKKATFNEKRRKQRDFEEARKRMMMYQLPTIQQIKDSQAETWTSLPR